MNQVLLQIIGSHLIKTLSVVIKIFLLFSGNPIVSQPDFEPLIINYDHQDYNHNPQDYTIGYHNWAVAVDSTGVVYIGNDKGLLEFDGANWQLYEMSEGHAVRSVYIDNNRIYTGSFEEFGYWTRTIKGELTYTSLSDSLEQESLYNDDIWRIISHKEKIYFQSFATLYIYDYNEINIVKPEFTMVLLQKAKNRLFVHGVDRGLFEVIDNKFTFLEGSDVLKNDEIKVVLPFTNDQLLLGGASSGLYLYDGQAVQAWAAPVNKYMENVQLNTGIKVGDFFVIGSIIDGLYIFDTRGQLIRRLTIDNGLQSNTVIALHMEQSGQFWAATDVGVEFVKLDNEMQIYRGANFQRIGRVFTGTKKGNNLIVGSNKGLFKWVYSPLDGYSMPSLLPGTEGQVWGLFNFNDQIFCGHNEGTFILQDSNTPHWISYINGGSYIKEVISDNQSYLIESTYSLLVVYAWTEEGWTFSHTVSGMVGEPIAHFDFDKEGDIWAIHNVKGLLKIQLNPRDCSINCVIIKE